MPPTTDDDGTSGNEVRSRSGYDTTGAQSGSGNEPSTRLGYNRPRSPARMWMFSAAVMGLVITLIMWIP
ncbi:hypothetical protein GGR53DRAFT_467295 [Hypoxylon sp. FL1150]|nr:hypothetical protein GGR53DRAFT_467295 [Hypoxylon sp. FL1150]